MVNNQEIEALFQNPEDSYLIHFAHYEQNGATGSLRKIISIHAKNLNSSDSREFSIDKFASNKDILAEDIDDWFDEIELSILDEFNSFLKEKSACNFIYFVEEEGQGLILDELKRIFDARNKAEDEKVFKEISISKRKSISYLFAFDSQDQSLKDFIKRFNSNKLPIAFLTIGEEGVCFEKKQFNKVRDSVLCKINFFIKILNRNKNRKVSKTTNDSTLDIEGVKPADIFKYMNLKSWGILFGILAFIFSLGMGFNGLLNSNKVNNLEDQNKKLIEKVSIIETRNNKRKTVIIDSMEISKQNKIEYFKFKLDSLINILYPKSDSAK